ncbi:MAG: LacI family DNA-binding transcriptional regulator [Bacillota bacterium]
MSVTIKDIAKKTGVSYTTVSRALNGKSGVNQATMKKVLAEAKKMGYKPNAIARGLVTKHTKTIGLVIPDITNPFFPTIASGVEEAASKHHYNVFLCNTNWDKDKELAYLKLLQERRVDGIIIKAASDDEEIEQYLSTPTVFIDSRPAGGKYSSVETDNFRGGYLATNHLIELGYKKIAFVGGHSKSISNEARLEGYKRALSQHNYPIDESIIQRGDFKMKSGYDLMQKLLKSDNLPDAVIAVNDVMALGVLHCAQEYGLNIPDEFGICGFDNIPFAELPQVQLTTISQPTYYMGKSSFEILLEQIQNKDEKKMIKRVVLEPELIVRKTTRSEKANLKVQNVLKEIVNS